jgi:hypothetical protein
MEETMIWGKGLGCGILEGKCEFYGHRCETRKTFEGYTEQGKQVSSGCYHDYTTQAMCQNEIYQDDCMLMLEANNERLDCRKRSNGKLDISNGAKFLGEFYGFGSRCFEGDIEADTDDGKYITTNKAFCFQSECKNGAIVFKINGKEETCHSTGQKITNPGGLTGYIICPKIEKFCYLKEQSCEEDCHLQGRCVKNNKCWCYPGFYGNSCQHEGEPPKEDDANDKGNPEQNAENAENGKKSITDQSCETFLDCWKISDNSYCSEGKCRCLSSEEGSC